MLALLNAAFEEGVKGEKIELVVKLMLHELEETTHAPTFLPLPISVVALRLADLALDDRRNALSLEEPTSQAATSIRTASRLFPAETGLTLKSWRQRARIVQTVDRLARGKPIAQVAIEFGFASTASFSSSSAGRCHAPDGVPWNAIVIG